MNKSTQQLRNRLQKLKVRIDDILELQSQTGKDFTTDAWGIPIETKILQSDLTKLNHEFTATIYQETGRKQGQDDVHRDQERLKSFEDS